MQTECSERFKDLSGPVRAHVSNARPAACHIILCGPREHMMVLKIKIYAALYRKLWKCISATQVSVSIWLSIYKQKWTLVRIWYAVVRIRGVGFFVWWRLRGSCILKGIKRTSSSAPPTEKHDILDSRIKKSIVACLRWFLWSYCNDKCPERISLCERALNARRKSLCSQVDSFTLTENGCAFNQPDLHASAQKISSLQSLINAIWSVGIHWQKHTLAHMPANVKQYLHSSSCINVSVPYGSRIVPQNHIYCPATDL